MRRFMVIMVLAAGVLTLAAPVGAAAPNTVLRWSVDDCRFGLRFRDALKTGRPEAAMIALNDRQPAGGACMIQRPTVDFVRADGSPGSWSPGGRGYREVRRWLYSTAFQEDPSATATGGYFHVTKIWHRGGRDYCAEQATIEAAVDGPANGTLLSRERFPLFPGAACP